MKIGIDARLYGTKHGGLGRYSENLIKQLEKIDYNNQYFIFLQKSNFDYYQPQNKNFKKVLADFSVYSFKEQLLFPFLLKKYKLDLVHFAHFNAPIFYAGKFIVTIHDLIISHYADSRATTLNPIIYKIKVWFYRLVIKIVTKKSAKIITVSEYTKKDIIKLLNINDSKIFVTYEGVDLPKESNIDCAKLKNDLMITKDFLLYVGSAYPHKNLEKLILAFEDVIVQKKNLQLVLVGKKNYFYNRLEKIIKDKKLSNDILLTDYLSDDELSCLYKTAKLYILPSLIEGFGLPPLEAQSYGLPVLSSSATCLPEILGDSALYFDPNNTTELTKLIINTINNQNIIADLKIKGFDNLGRYSWSKCALETIKQYQS